VYAHELTQVQSRQHTLPLLQLDDWDEERIYIYNEDPPSCIHYSIEWKVTLNALVVPKDTEQDLVLNPGSHWKLFLNPKLDKILYKKYPRQRVEIDDTGVVA
jgi:hypothetical protein